MNEAQIFGRGIAFPPRVGEDGRFAWSEGVQNIRESIEIILLTEREERLQLPEFGGGLRSFLFEPNTASTRRLLQERIGQSLAQWEPRIRVEAVTVEQDSQDERMANVVIQYTLVANGASGQESLSIRLQ